MEYKKLFPMNLQFFAEDNAGTGEPEGTPEGTPDGTEPTPTPDAGTTESGEKTFTQAELNAIAAKEKSQGKTSILKMFGIKDEKTAKEQAEAFKQWQAEQQSIQDKLNTSQTELKDAEARAELAELKLSCIMAGVNNESIEDILAIAATKVTDDKTIDKVLEEMKKETKYAGFFSTPSANSTGTSPDHRDKGGKPEENFGARLAKSSAGTKPAKSSYFSN